MDEAKKLGNPKTFNIIVLGAAAKHTWILTRLSGYAL